MRKSRVRLAFFLAAIAAIALSVAVMGGPARGATQAVRGRAAASFDWFQLKSADYGNACITESGTTSAVTGAACSSGKADYWRWTAAGELLGEKSGRCLSVTGTRPGVYLNTCTNNHAQLWTQQTVDVFAGGKLYLYAELLNVHTGDSLGLNLGTFVAQEPSGDILWYRP